MTVDGREAADASASTGHSTLYAGAAQVSITPDSSVPLQGYKLRIAEGVDEPVIASALAIGAEGPARIDWLLISLDLIGVDRTFTARIRETLTHSLAVSADRITLACSHTHSGPATLANLGPVPAERDYLKLLEARVLEVARQAAASMQPVTLRIGTSLVDENVNRRERKGSSIRLGINPDGPVDHRLWVARFDLNHAEKGTAVAPPLAIIVQYACHATCTDQLRIHADWPGVMRKTLQGWYGRSGIGPVVCFIQGCAGDVTHSIGRDAKRWPDHAGISTEVQAAIMGRLVGAGAMVAIERSRPQRTTTISAGVADLDLSFDREAGSERTEVQVVRIGGATATAPEQGSVLDGTAERFYSPESAIWMVFLPGEPFATYGDVLCRTFVRSFHAASAGVVVSGYANDAVGYLCTPRALREGGYESADAHRIYHRPAPFGEGTLSAVERACAAAAARLDHQHSQTGVTRMRTLFEGIRSAVMRRQPGPSTGRLI